MRLENNNQQSRPAEEIVSQTEVKKQVRHIGSIMPHEGHTLWEYDLNSLHLAPAEFSGAETIDFPLDGAPVKINKRVIVKENCIYLGALNKNSALRKIEKTYHLSKQLYDQEYKTINAYLGAQISRWFDYAEREGDSQKRTDLLLLLQNDWEKWIYAKNQHLHTYYRHLFMERWGQTIKMITSSKTQQDAGEDN